MKAFGIVAALSALLAVDSAFPQESYPDKPLRIMVGFVAGGPADIIARVVGDKLTEAWGKPVVIENVTGSGGNMATERVAKSAPDGYTLLLGTSGPFVIHPSAVINRSEKQTFHLMPKLVEAGAVKKVEGRWTGNVRKLLALVGGE